MSFTELHEKEGAFLRERGEARVQTKLAVIDLRTGRTVWTGSTMEEHASSIFGIPKPSLADPMEETIRKIERMAPAL